MDKGAIKAVLGPTNTGKTHLAIERMCGHSSGVIGFPLRLLAREVYERVVAIKGPAQVALITGEERIEPPQARYFCCTTEAMPADGADAAFVALDEAQLGADPERGHIFTDRMLRARGREETMLLGSATLAPLIRELVPGAHIGERPRFSTLTHAGSAKLSRLPPRSAVVAFSAEQVYVVAEMLRRFRGGAAVVMGALSPETRNRQVDLFQNGEVDYIVATDAIGMGLNLDIDHVAFASLTKFDGARKRRLHPAEMAQIAGRAGRHQRDGSFGTLAGVGAHVGSGRESPEFTEEEIYAIEEHRFAPITRLFWRESQPRYDSVATLIEDLETRPDDPALASAPEAIDLAVLKRLASDGLAQDIGDAAQVRRLWDACSLPDFRQSGVEVHARFVGRLWRDLRQDYLGADYVAARIAELDNVQGDIHALQGRIAAIRSWAYICQRPDWVLARDEMAQRARGVEARLSDALHARLTERFVSRRTAVLVRSLGKDAGLLPVTLAHDGELLVEQESIGRLRGFRFEVDHRADHRDRKMLLAAGEKAMPKILAERAHALASGNLADLTLDRGRIVWQGIELAEIDRNSSVSGLRIEPGAELASVPADAREALLHAIRRWLDDRLTPLAPLAAIEVASRSEEGGSEVRALLLKLIAGAGYVARQSAGLEHVPKDLRPYLRKLGVHLGALDIYAPALLKPAARAMLHDLGRDRRPLERDMRPVVSGGRKLPSGYRPAGEQAIRIDMADKIIRAAHEARVRQREAGVSRVVIDNALAVSAGLTVRSFERLLATAGFRQHRAPHLAEGAFGPAHPDRWSWRPFQPDKSSFKSAKGSKKGKGKARAQRGPVAGNPFASLADLVR